MLWYQSWLETRWRFVIGLVVLVCSAAALVLAYPAVEARLPLATPVDFGRGPIGQRIREGLELAREYRGYVWWQWFRQDLPQLWTLFAVLLGTGGLLSQRAGAAALFTLSLPVSRIRLAGTRAATGLAESLVLAILPVLAIPLLSPAVGEAFSLGDALVHGMCLFVGGAVFFSLAFLLSTIFGDVWRPAVLAIALALLLGLAEQAWRASAPYGIFHVMSASSYFRAGELPWAGLAASAAASAALLYAAARNIARRDF